MDGEKTKKKLLLKCTRIPISMYNFGFKDIQDGGLLRGKHHEEIDHEKIKYNYHYECII